MGCSPNLYAAGNCTWYCRDRECWVPDDLGNAYQWLANYNGPKSSTPVAGSIVVYNRGGLYSASDGHVGVVEGVNTDGTFDVSEMDFRGLGIVSSRTSTMAGVAGFMLPPGSTGATLDSFSIPSPFGGSLSVPSPSDVANSITGAVSGAVGSIEQGFFTAASTLIADEIKALFTVVTTAGSDLVTYLHKSAIALAVAAVVLLVVL